MLLRHCSLKSNVFNPMAAKGVCSLCNEDPFPMVVVVVVVLVDELLLFVSIFILLDVVVAVYGLGTFVLLLLLFIGEFYVRFVVGF